MTATADGLYRIKWWDDEWIGKDLKEGSLRFAWKPQETSARAASETAGIQTKQLLNASLVGYPYIKPFQWLEY
jgi:hypothetical protein